MSNVYIYTRFSTGQQREESHEAQERKVRQLFDSYGIDHSNAIVIKESAERGDDEARQAYEEFVAAVHRGEVKVAGVDEQSRLSRGLSIEGTIKDIVFFGGRFVSCDGIDTNRPGWEDLVGLKQIHSRMEIRATGARVRRSQELRIEKPNGSAGDFPYGYSSEYENPEAALNYRGRGPKPAKRVIVLDLAAALIVLIFKRFVLENQSISEIARWWESVKDQYPPHTKSKLLPSHIRRILQNKKYVGIWTYGATTTLRSGGGKKKQTGLRPYQKAITVDRPSLRIVSDELFDAAQEKLAKLKDIYGSKPAGKRRGPAHHYKLLYAKSPVAGKFYCGTCGSRLNVNGSNKGVKRLGCPNHTAGTCPATTRVKYAAAEAAVIEIVVGVLTALPPWVEAVIKAMHESIADSVKQVPSELAQAEKRLGEVGGEIKNLVDFIKKGSDLPEIHNEISALKAEQAVLQKKIRVLSQSKIEKHELPNEKWIRDQFKDLASILVTGGAGAALLVREMISKIVVEQVTAPGKERGFVRLRFSINGWPALKQVLGKGLPGHVVASLKPASSLLIGEEFVIDLGEPTLMDQWAPQIVQWRAEGVKWVEIARRTGLKLSNAYIAYKRYLRGKDAA